MQKVFLDVSHCGNGYAPKDWWLAQTINIIRLYYIKGGDGGYFDQTGKKVKFKANHIYIHPYNLRDHFYTSYENPIDHIFFDFAQKNAPSCDRSISFVLLKSYSTFLLDSVTIMQRFNLFFHKLTIRNIYYQTD